jgi:succinoglycan biosynthesis protein ExoL
LILFAPDLTDISTIKRAHAFLNHGFELVVFGFRRNRYNSDYVPHWPHVELGRTADRRYWRRLGALARALRILMARRHLLTDASLFYARNIDQLLLALLVRRIFGGRAAVVYEVLDVQPAFAGRGLLAKALRAIERLCLRRIKLLVVSSPGFMHNYYLPVQRYAKPWYLLENKLDPSTLPSTLAKSQADRRRGQRRRWVVGYFGLIRGQETFELITRLAERLREHVEFRFRGILTTVDHDRFFEVIRRHENIHYDGEYVSPRDLAAIYGEVDFAWALDLEHVEHNSRWLLPCRFYEAGLVGVPCLAAHGFEVGRLVERLGVGWTFDAPFEDALVTFFTGLTQEEYGRKRQRLAKLPSSTFVAGADIDGLCELLKSEASVHLAEVKAPMRAAAQPALPVVGAARSPDAD